MSNQAAYTDVVAGLAGQVATQIPAVLASAAVEGSGGIPFGAVAVRGTADRSAKVAGANGDTLYLGIAVRSVDARLTSAGADKYPQYSELEYIQKGEVFVVAGANVTPGLPVYYSEADGTVIKGASATNYTQIVGATWETTTASGAIGKIRLR